MQLGLCGPGLAAGPALWDPPGQASPPASPSGPGAGLGHCSCTHVRAWASRLWGAASMGHGSGPGRLQMPAGQGGPMALQSPLLSAWSLGPRVMSVTMRRARAEQGQRGQAGQNTEAPSSVVRGAWRVLQQACPRGCDVCSLEAWAWPGPSPVWAPQALRIKKGAWCGDAWPGARPGSFLKQVFATRPWQWG